MEVKEAADRAAEYLKNLIPDADRIQLEEIELNELNQWYITLSYDSSDTSPNVFSFTRTRKYKIFKIDADNGQVLSMKIREIK
jgi:hypothetical protein